MTCDYQQVAQVQQRKPRDEAPTVLTDYFFLSPHRVMGSERFAGLADYSHMTVSRNCGGSHTVNSASQRRQPAKHYAHAEVDLMVQVVMQSFRLCFR